MGAATLASLLGTLAAYALARFRFNRPANDTLTTWFPVGGYRRSWS
ncbi:MAG: hypothetical protein R2838_17890 [Caldilineaceae bacterium]